MTDKLKELLESQVLGPEVKVALQEAFEARVAQAESQLQESYAARYAHDRATLVEAMDTMVQEAVESEMRDFRDDKKSLNIQRVRLAEETTKIKNELQAKYKNDQARVSKFLETQLRAEFRDFYRERNTMRAERKNWAQQVQEHKKNTQRQLNERIGKMETFILRALSEEIASFEADKKSLVEQKATLARLGKKKIQETQEQLIKRTTTIAENMLNTVIAKELAAWREDIKSARENNFGRRIFEAFASEYMGSYLSEGSQVKKLNAQLAESQKLIQETARQLKEKTRLVEAADQKIAAAQERTRRVEVLNELTSSLSRDKKAIMLEMLADVKTANLKESFSRYLPNVVNTPSSIGSKKTLAENRLGQRSVAVTGDRQRLVETTKVQEPSSDDLGEILYLAGINPTREIKEN